MAYAIRVRDAYPLKVGKHRHGWLGRWSTFAVESINDAMRWGSEQSALTAALLTIPKRPEFIGRLEVVCIVVGPGKFDGWRIHRQQPKKEKRRGTVLR